MTRQHLTAALIAITTVGVDGCARSTRPDDAPSTAAVDPGEHTNRAIFAFNRAVDHAIVRPVARGYSHLPHPVKQGVHNFVQNLQEPTVFINDVLQANVLRSLNTGGRFIINSTIGVVGIFDVANHFGMPHHAADLGQTFGVWGMAPGRTVEFPVFGSSNVRDSVGQVLNIVFNPIGKHSDTVSTLNTAKSVGGVVDGRAGALPVTDRMEQSDDYYAALRDAATARRARFVEDGKIGAVRERTPPGEGRAAAGLPMNP